MTASFFILGVRTVEGEAERGSVGGRGGRGGGFGGGEGGGGGVPLWLSKVQPVKYRHPLAKSGNISRGEGGGVAWCESPSFFTFKNLSH